MPTHSTRRTISRQWELLKLLPNRAPGLTAAELHQQLEEAGHRTTKRTVERDLNELSSLFPLHCNDKGTPYGWYWQPGRSIDLPGITVGEALTLRLVEDSIRPLVPGLMLKSLEPRFSQARQKLKALSEESASARWIDKVASVQPTLNLIAPDIKAEHLDLLQRALLEDLQLLCLYQSANKNRVHELTLNPLAMVQRGQITYLVACADTFDDVRLYAAHRFEAVTMLGQPGRRPAGFDLRNYIQTGAMQFGATQAIQLHAWVDPALAKRLHETPLSEDMTLIAESDGARLTATVNDSWELKWWLLSQAGSIRVDAPTTLRQVLIDSQRQSLALHDTSI